MATVAPKLVPLPSRGRIVPSLRRQGHERRVVVTGIGVVTPFGNDLRVFWSALLEGRSCITNLSRVDTSDFPVHIGGQVAEVQPTPFLPELLIRRNDLFTNIGLLAGGLALKSSGLGALADEKRPISVMVGSAFGAMQGLQDVYDSYFTRGWRKMHPLAVPRNMFNSLSSNLFDPIQAGRQPVHRGRGLRLGRGGTRRGVPAHSPRRGRRGVGRRCRCADLR